MRLFRCAIEPDLTVVPGQSRQHPRHACVLLPSQPSVEPLTRLIGICRIIRIVGKAARFGYGLLLTLLDRFPLIFVGMRVRMTRTPLGARGNGGLGHDLLLYATLFHSEYRYRVWMVVDLIY